MYVSEYCANSAEDVLNCKIWPSFVLVTSGMLPTFDLCSYSFVYLHNVQPIFSALLAIHLEIGERNRLNSDFGKLNTNVKWINVTWLIELEIRLTFSLIEIYIILSMWNIENITHCQVNIWEIFILIMLINQN